MGRVAVAIDIAAVLLFVGIGRAVHADAASLPGFASTAWPFASGLALGWLALLALKLPVEALVSGLVVALSTVVFGMTLRVVSGQGTALAFILVAVAFLGAEMLGWRLSRGSSDRLDQRAGNPKTDERTRRPVEPRSDN